MKIRGHRIELGEIEAVLDRHPGGRAVRRRGPTTTAATPRLVAYVVLGDGRRGRRERVARARRRRAARRPWCRPPSCGIDAFPLTPNGKVDRKALPAVDGDDRGRCAPAQVAAPPADDTEKLVADIWTDELGCAVGRDDNFFDIGGHSLLAVKVFRRLSDATGAPLALTDVFRFPTVRTFAAHLGELQGTSSARAGRPGRRWSDRW